MSDYKSHYSVLLDECIEHLIRDFSGEYVIADLTFGGGGHTFSLLEKDSKAHLFCTDQDPDALNNGRKRIQESNYEQRVHLVDTNFSHMKSHYKAQDFKIPLMGALMDLGVSSHHFDEPTRGFSFRFDGPLDMRMDADNDEIPTAADLLNTLSEEEIANIIYEYGEERRSRRIAQAIVEKRREEPIKTTKELENLVFHCYPKNERFRGSHPATRTFQALRIKVNNELGILEQTLEDLVELMEFGGRICVITFHSLEDRIIKHKFKELAKEKGLGKILTKKPILPSQHELNENPRSRSAKLRVFEKCKQEAKYGKKEKEK